LKKNKTATGPIKVHPDGFAFVSPDDGEPGDIYVGSRARAGALDGDKVRVQWQEGPRGYDGSVVAIEERIRTRLTGEMISPGAGIRPNFVPDDPRITNRIRVRGTFKDQEPGFSIVADIVAYPESPEDPIEVRLTRIIGGHDDPRTEIEKILIGANVDDEFPAPVQKAMKTVPDVVRPEDLIDRTDLRDLPFAPIDPESARDFDDAVALEQLDGGRHRLWVAVADVSHYVRENSAIDREAFARATSIYLPNRAIPMLPEPLSAHICSLLPEQDRLAMVTRIDFDREGRPIDSDFCAAVIHSRARLDYPGVAAALSGELKGARRKLYQPWVESLERMAAVAAVLRERRMERGALDLDLPEARIELDQDDPRRVRDVRRARKDPRERQAYNLIEEFMLAANEAVARSFTERQEPTLWRIHARPDATKLQTFVELAQSYGIATHDEDLATPRGMREVLAALKGHAAEKPLSFQLLRSLKQASYDVGNVGHFGLAASDYVHYTSPIRRYPDLVVHRLMKRRLARLGRPSGGFGRGPGDEQEPDKLALQASHCSSRERRAQEIERESVDVYRVFFMRDRVGDTFKGVITGVTGFGVFVQIDEPFVEGLVRVEDLPSDAYNFDDKTLRLVGQRGGLALGLGQEVEVVVANVSLARRKIDLRLSQIPASVPGPQAGPGRGRGRKADWRPGPTATDSAGGRTARRKSPGEQTKPGKTERRKGGRGARWSK